MSKVYFGVLVGISGAFLLVLAAPAWSGENYDVMLPNERWKTPFAQRRPMHFVNRGESAAEWDKLPSFWNESTETVVHPETGLKVTRKIVKIKVPLGLTKNPPVPPENPMTVAKWALGKKLYFDPILSSDATISCATCHDPGRGYTDQSMVSTGIGGLKGGVSAPTVFNSSYNPLQFWDGRAPSLEDQSQGPPMNPVEMFSGEGHAWNSVVQRLRSKPGYVKQFKAVFGTLPTRDATAKAIASYERTVLSGNSIHDRARLAMLFRIAEEGSVQLVIKSRDYAKVLKEAFDARDVPALSALKLDPARDVANIPEVAKQLSNGRKVFFGKAGCNACHVGDNFTDNLFHNLGVGVKDGKIPDNQQGRFAVLPIGHKDPTAMGAFKTPTLRHLVHTAPYLHDGSEATLEKVVEFYDRGGNANRYLDPRMRDGKAEIAYRLSRKNKTPYKGPKVHLMGPDQQPIIPRPLKLTDQEKKDLVLFMRALQGDPADPIVADPNKFPK